MVRRRGLTRWLVLGGVGFTLSGFAALRPHDDDRRSQTSFPPELAVELQAAIDGWAEAPNHRGVSAAVILSNGDEWVGTAGSEGADEPLQPEHLIWIASITKTMTGSVIMGLAEDGVLDLDDPISRWLDEMENVDPDITIRQLLNHTNGLANYTASPALQTDINADATHVFTAAELISHVGPQSFDRGERTQYTNTSFVLLGMVASAATDRPITELYHERLWGPLGLEEIFLPGQEEPVGPVANAWAGPPPNQEEVAPMELMSLITIGNSGFGLFSNARTCSSMGESSFHRSGFR